MPITFSLKRNKKYEWRWPQEAPNGDGEMKPVPPDDQLVLSMRRLAEPDIEEIENKQFRAHVSQDQMANKSPAIETGDMELSLQSGTVKKIKVERAVVGWGNIQDEHNTAVPFSPAHLFEVIRGNAGFPSNDEGIPNLSDDLAAHIDEENNLTRNPQKVGG